MLSFVYEPGRSEWLGSPPLPGAECRVLPGRACLTLGRLPALGLGRVGNFFARDEEAAVQLLQDACEELGGKVLGPMDGPSTWYPYRLALGGPGEFFRGEPSNPPQYPAWFQKAGFVEDQHYTSRLVRGPGALCPEARPCDDFPRLHAFLNEAFSDNVYFTPIPFAEFEAMYHPLTALASVLVIGEIDAMVMFYPDRERIVLKTLATAPAARGRGLGKLLTAHVQALAGDRPVLHALMHQGNASQGISKRYEGEVWRNYALYRWEQPRGA